VRLDCVEQAVRGFFVQYHRVAVSSANMVRADIYHAVASEVMERALGVAGRATKAAIVEVDRSAAAAVEVELQAIRKDSLARIAKVGKKLKRGKALRIPVLVISGAVLVIWLVAGH
jgi:hypothetical protein